MFPGARFSPNPKFSPAMNSELVYELQDSESHRKMQVRIERSGVVSVAGGRTVDDAVRILSGVRATLQRELGLPGSFKFQIRFGANRVFYGRGIRIASVPSVIPKSIYLNLEPALTGGDPEGLNLAPSGKYNRGGSVHPVISVDEAVRVTLEVLTGRPSEGLVPQSFLGFLGLLDVPDWCRHLAVCRLPRSSLAAIMPRSLDKSGNVALTGSVQFTTPGSIAQLSLARSELLELLDQHNLFGTLTPFDQIPADVQHDASALDYNATNEEYWPEQSWTTVP